MKSEQPPAKPAKKVRIPVQIKSAAELGPRFMSFNGNRRRYPGDKFYIESEAEFSPKYMIRLDQKPSIVDASDPSQTALDEVEEEETLAVLPVDPRLVNPPREEKTRKKVNLKKRAIVEETE